MKLFLNIMLIVSFQAGTYAKNDSLSPDTSRRVKEYVDKISVSLNFTHVIVPPYNYSPKGFSLILNYKVWRNFSVGFYNGLNFSKDVANHDDFYTSHDIYLNTMASVGYQYYIYKNHLAFGLYGLGGIYHRRIESHVQDKKNSIDRDYRASHTDACIGAAFDMHFAINRKFAVSASASIFSNPYWGIDNYAGLGFVYNIGTRLYTSRKK